jgi:hypothetical protein
MRIVSRIWFSKLSVPSWRHSKPKSASAGNI